MKRKLVEKWFTDRNLLLLLYQILIVTEKIDKAFEFVSEVRTRCLSKFRKNINVHMLY